MSNDNLRNLLNDEIDRLLASDSAEMPEHPQYNEECQDLLKLAAALAKVDFTPARKKSFAEFAGQIKNKNNAELNDDELDLVAGGVDLKWFLEKNEGKK